MRQCGLDGRDDLRRIGHCPWPEAVDNASTRDDQKLLEVPLHVAASPSASGTLVNSV